MFDFGKGNNEQNLVANNIPLLSNHKPFSLHVPISQVPPSSQQHEHKPSFAASHP